MSDFTKNEDLFAPTDAELLIMSEDARALCDVELPDGFVESVMSEVKELARAKRIRKFCGVLSGALCAVVICFVGGAALSGGLFAKDGLSAPDSATQSEEFSALSPTGADKDFTPEAPGSTDTYSAYAGTALCVAEEIDRENILNISAGTKITLDGSEGTLRELLLQVYDLCEYSPNDTYVTVHILPDNSLYLRLYSKNGDLLLDFKQK